ncbi:acetate/propionate family kinase [Candidatus Saccharibacteria bacterium]|nr:acetate/propionate family kinase [Candidatus Saccharibacteria bacterium]MCB9821451.1 hypothetical protein [Candidatus Nomurabacteria bacterium]
MDKLILAINPGSTSYKYSFGLPDQNLLQLHYESLTDGSYVCTTRTPSGQTEQSIDAEIFSNSLKDCLDRAKQAEIPLDNLVVGLRLVAPGSYFAQNKLIDSEFELQLKQKTDMAPLHITAARHMITDLRQILPDTPIYAVSDSAIHANLPAVARSYAINAQDAANQDIFRFGYHGISVGSALRKLQAITTTAPEKVIVCHLGGGSSVTAIRNNQSIDTSMGFSPLEGLPMTTRSGTIDIGAALYLAKRKYLTDEQLLEYLNKQSGLLGISGTSDDIRTLIDQAAAGQQSAQAALDYFVYHIKHYIGAYVGLLNGLDTLVFTGTVGYRSAVIRNMVCNQLDYLGISLDEQKNNSLSSDGYINTHGKLGVAVIKTDEQSEIILKVHELLSRMGAN